MSMIMQAVGKPLGWIMWAMYQIIPNYVWALVLFTLLTRLCLVPLSFKQQKSSVKMNLMKPRMDEIQKKYKGNPTKMNEELSELYTEYGYSPTAGCLPLLIQMPILLGLIDVVYKPLTHVLRFSNEMLTTISEICTNAGIALSGYSPQITMLTAVKNNPSLFSAIGEDALSSISRFDMNFLGIFDLSLTPSAVGFGHIIMLIPILAGLTALGTSLITMRTSGMAGAGGMSNMMMMLMLPLMSFFFALNVAAGVGLYWSISNLFAMVQSLIMNKFHNPKEVAEKMAAQEEERKERLRQQKIEAKKLARAQNAANAEAALSQKEINRRKLAEARRRNAEKYGDEYVDVTDDDLK